jgi:hypothetical protein
MKVDPGIHALQRYFIWADRMKVHFEQVLARDGAKSICRGEGIDHFLYMSFWYGEMYVVIEGWKALGLSDPKIDDLLESKNVALLKRYRNGVFHFQKDYFDDRFTKFMVEQETATWIRELREEFSRYFLAYFKQNRDVTDNNIPKST